MDKNLSEILENEWYLVRYSGETPEIALHATIYFLTRAKDGPQLTLDNEQLGMYRQAAEARFSEIILRDLQHANSNTGSYRGIRRSITNFQRFSVFCERQQVDPGQVRRQVAEALHVFLATELAEIHKEQRPSIINCSFQELQVFASELGVHLLDTFPGIEAFCLAGE